MNFLSYFDSLTRGGGGEGGVSEFDENIEYFTRITNHEDYFNWKVNTIGINFPAEENDNRNNNDKKSTISENQKLQQQLDLDQNEFGDELERLFEFGVNTR